MYKTRKRETILVEFLRHEEKIDCEKVRKSGLCPFVNRSNTVLGVFGASYLDEIDGQLTEDCYRNMTPEEAIKLKIVKGKKDDDIGKLDCSVISWY